MKTNKQIILDECRRFKTPFLTRRYEIGEGGKNGESLTDREQIDSLAKWADELEQFIAFGDIETQYTSGYVRDVREECTELTAENHNLKSIIKTLQSSLETLTSEVDLGQADWRKRNGLSLD